MQLVWRKLRRLTTRLLAHYLGMVGSSGFYERFTVLPRCSFLDGGFMINIIMHELHVSDTPTFKVSEIEGSRQHNKSSKFFNRILEVLTGQSTSILEPLLPTQFPPKVQTPLPLQTNSKMSAFNTTQPFLLPSNYLPATSAFMPSDQPDLPTKSQIPLEPEATLPRIDRIQSFNVHSLQDNAASFVARALLRGTEEIISEILPGDLDLDMDDSDEDDLADADDPMPAESMFDPPPIQRASSRASNGDCDALASPRSQRSISRSVSTDPALAAILQRAQSKGFDLQPSPLFSKSLSRSVSIDPNALPSPRSVLKSTTTSAGTGPGTETAASPFGKPLSRSVSVDPNALPSPRSVLKSTTTGAGTGTGTETAASPFSKSLSRSVSIDPTTFTPNGSPRFSALSRATSNDFGTGSPFGTVLSRALSLDHNSAPQLTDGATSELISNEADGSLLVRTLSRAKSTDHFPCQLVRSRSSPNGAKAVEAESFTAMVVAELLMDTPFCGEVVQEVVEMLDEELAGDEGDMFYFFKEHGLLPADADCTALGLSVMLRSGLPAIEFSCGAALDNIKRYCSEGGVVTTYFVPPDNDRFGIVDAVVCCNVLYLAHQMGREREFLPSIRHVEKTLLDGSYMNGSRYYYSPDTFLFFLGRVIHAFPDSPLAALKPALAAAVTQRLGSTTHPIDLSQRVLLSCWFGVPGYEADLDVLVAQQQGDGSWPLDSLFQYGRREIYFGSEVLSTAFALAAVHEGMKGAACEAVS